MHSAIAFGRSDFFSPLFSPRRRPRLKRASRYTTSSLPPSLSQTSIVTCRGLRGWFRAPEACQPRYYTFSSRYSAQRPAGMTNILCCASDPDPDPTTSTCHDQCGVKCMRPLYRLDMNAEHELHTCCVLRHGKVPIRTGMPASAGVCL